jgi:predicted phage baseplate assembly protein
MPGTANWRFETTGLHDLGVVPVAPPRGGRTAESVDEALARAREQRRVPFRTVTAQDHAFIATHTPGLRFGRATLVDAPAGAGEATVVVVPYSPDGRRPVPSAGFLAAVEEHCCRHSLLTETVSVVGPTFVPVDISVTVEPVTTTNPDRVRHDVRESLASFLDPLDGFEGDGWPFGRPVYTSELYERLEGIDVVVDAVDVGVSTRGRVAIGDRSDTLPSLDGVDVVLTTGDDSCGGWS